MKGYRTIIVNAALAVIPFLTVLSQVLAMPELQPFIPEKDMPAYMLIGAVINLYLRTITTTPVGKKL